MAFLPLSDFYCFAVISKSGKIHFSSKFGIKSWEIEFVLSGQIDVWYCAESSQKIFNFHVFLEE